MPRIEPAPRAEAFGRVVCPRTIVPAAWATAALLPRRRDAARLALGTTTAVLAANAIKHVVSRHRPRLLGSSPWDSFPSGHSAAASAYLFATALAAPRAYRISALVAATAATMAVNALRITAGEHWPGDVVAGNAIGVAALGATELALAAVERRASATAREEDGGEPSGQKARR
ncbi:MAG TPA: phosphatase PAP2 family protein [Candidatus Binatia bacterium]|nr:phosphatase PAP2 family protein [Candidatus Binatia bacterium]